MQQRQWRYVDGSSSGLKLLAKPQVLLAQRLQLGLNRTVRGHGQSRDHDESSEETRDEGWQPHVTWPP